MKKILLTGCKGQLGRAVRKEYGDEVSFILTDFADDGEVRALDITDMEAVLGMVRSGKPDVIINCAAMTNVDGCETDFETAFRVNALGPRNLAIASMEVGAKVIHISTDYVFPGTDPEPLMESARPDPISAYGRSKLWGEDYVRQFSDRWFILRTAWLYGDGKNFVRTMLKLSESHDEISVVDDQFGSPTSADELARVIHRLEPTHLYGVYHATCEGSVSWAVFAEEIFRKFGRTTKVRHVSSREYKKMNPASADRPPFSILDNAMLRMQGMEPMSDWKDAFATWVAKEKVDINR
ncbi:MAG: dTDP-4-dehydrorhamnose reductase [Eubacterium sp.]|nr:dTDP-4-dehydrorhamnose reductase [Eubacterium sp.]